ncbi:MAG: deoxyguanosinetriphosphate triphosphohydrolase [Actinomycetota bacterium]|nr:deoxyguanosinetriphosphate triphosphohydrolase [Actinomycetota bacterium]
MSRTWRERIEEQEERRLSERAQLASGSKGRDRAEPDDDLMTCYQRDRDRIIHSKAFRRLAHKTQVFLAPEGDHYRVRLTHTLEVTQVARTIARALSLNEDLVEAICLGHDLGHTPFGHLGEEVVAAFHPGFRHNLQSVRIVEVLEGLNLTWEVRDGIANHTWSMPMPATLEGQIARFADRIAYLNHDIDDSMRAGILDPDGLPPVTTNVLGATQSERIHRMVNDIVTASEGEESIRMTPPVFEAMAETRRFLFESVYVGRIGGSTREAVARILQTLLAHHAEATDDAAARQEAVDYVAGMTDRFALRAFEALVDGPPPGLSGLE